MISCKLQQDEYSSRTMEDQHRMYNSVIYGSLLQQMSMNILHD